MNSTDTTNQTYMTNGDLQKVRATAVILYTSLYGTEAGRICADIVRKFQEAQCKTVTEPFDYDEAIQIDENHWRERQDKSLAVSEEQIRENNLDVFVNESLEGLRKAKQQYPEGAYQQSMVDYLIYCMEGVKNRELSLDDNGPLENDMPGSSVNDKVANYGFIRRNVEKKLNPETGKEEYVFPADYEKDEDIFAPRFDQTRRTTYTQEELQESADRINFRGFNDAGFAYKKTLMENINLVGMRVPASEEEERILAEHVLASMDDAEREMRRAMRVDPNDPVALRAFDNVEGHLADTITSPNRGMNGNINQYNVYRKYVAGGLPASGFGEYSAMRKTLVTLTANVDKLDKELLANAGDLKKACQTCGDLLDNVPPKGATAEERKAWQESVRESMLRIVEEKKKVEENPQFRDGVSEDDRKSAMRDLTQDDVAIRVTKISDQYVNQITQLGKQTAMNRQRYVDNMLKGMSEEMDQMGREVTALAKKQKNLSPALREAVKQVAKTGDSNLAYTPEDFQNALSTLMKEAQNEKSGNKELAEWAKNSLAHHQNRMSEAQRKGAMIDEPINLQRVANVRNGKDNFDASLAMFNTKRAGIFKNETKEHEALRLAAEKYDKAKRELAGMKPDVNDKDYMKKAQEVQSLAGDMSTAAMNYMKEKKFSANTPAGQQRLAGAMELYKEGRIKQVELKKEQNTLTRYQEMVKDTQRIRERNQQMEERYRQEDQRQREQQAKQNAPQQNAPQQPQQKGPKSAPANQPGVKDTDFAALQQKLGQGASERTFHERKSAPAMSGPGLDGPAKKGPGKFGP